MIKRLIANGFYVMAEDWLHPNEDIGHVTILRGYDDGEGVFIADDSYLGNNIVYKYEEFDQTQWKPFNREYLPLYLPDQEKKLRDLIAEPFGFLPVPFDFHTNHYMLVLSQHVIQQKNHWPTNLHQPNEALLDIDLTQPMSV